MDGRKVLSLRSRSRDPLQQALAAGIEAGNRLQINEPMLQPLRTLEEIRQAAPPAGPRPPQSEPPSSALASRG